MAWPLARAQIVLLLCSDVHVRDVNLWILLGVVVGEERHYVLDWVADELRFEMATELYACHLGLLLLYVHDLLNGVVKIEVLYDLPELASIQLGKVKQVIHQEGHHVGRRVLDAVAGLNHLDHLLQGLLHFLHALAVVAAYQIYQFLETKVNLEVLSANGLKGIP